MFYKECKLCGNYANNLCVVLNKPVQPENECILLSSNEDSIHDREAEVLEQIKAAESLLEINRSFLGTLKTMKEKLHSKPILPMDRKLDHFFKGQEVFVIHFDTWTRGTVTNINGAVVEFLTDADGASAIAIWSPAIITLDEYKFFGENDNYYIWWYATAMQKQQEAKEATERKFNPLKRVR